MYSRSLSPVRSRTEPRTPQPISHSGQSRRIASLAARVRRAKARTSGASATGPSSGSSPTSEDLLQRVVVDGQFPAIGQVEQLAAQPRQAGAAEPAGGEPQRHRADVRGQVDDPALAAQGQDVGDLVRAEFLGGAVAELAPVGFVEFAEPARLGSLPNRRPPRTSDPDARPPRWPAAPRTSPEHRRLDSSDPCEPPSPGRSRAAPAAPRSEGSSGKKRRGKPDTCNPPRRPERVARCDVSARERGHRLWIRASRSRILLASAGPTRPQFRFAPVPCQAPEHGPADLDFAEPRSLEIWAV